MLMNAGPGAEKGDVNAPPWIFGYGSLVWRPAFPYVERCPARVSGWTRRFWQGSIDHRGVPGAPGRVVTLVEEADATCVGMAYRIDPAHEKDVLDALDVREKGGYDRVTVDLELASGKEPGLLYLATASNPNYLGPAALEEIARQVRSSQGPSGPNVEYVLRLAESLRELDAEDAHVFALERLLAP